MGWRPESLKKTLSSVTGTFNKSEIIICVPDKGLTYPSISNSKQPIVLTLQLANKEFGYGGASERATSFGHVRNLLLLISNSLDRSQSIIFFDDDVIPNEQTKVAFQNALQKYDLVQGKYSGCGGNYVYSMVSFFSLLEQTRWNQTEFTQRAREFLGGAAPLPERTAGISGLAGGVMGISSRFKTKMCFAPTRYRIEDHFFEFSSRFLLRGFRFMDDKTSLSDIPIAFHDKTAGSENSLVEGYTHEVKGAIIEKYLYFRLSGCLPAIVNGSHALIQTDDFDIEEITGKTLHEVALEKFKFAAEHWLSKNPPMFIAQQLQRIARLTEKDFHLSRRELDSEWLAFEKERTWFKTAETSEVKISHSF